MFMQEPFLSEMHKGWFEPSEDAKSLSIWLLFYFILPVELKIPEKGAVLATDSNFFLVSRCADRFFQSPNQMGLVHFLNSWNFWS